VLRFLKLSILPLLFASSTISAHAQLAVYAAPTFSDYGYGSNGSVSLGSGSGGLMAGGFYNFPIQSRLTAGIDLRTTYSFGTHGGSFTGAAFRIGFEPHRNRLRPYFLFGAGAVSTTGIGSVTTTYSPTQGYIVTSTNKTYTSGALEIDFGLDIKLTDHFDLRALDYGAAAGSSAAVGFLDAGILYRFHPRTP
jgi:hypothetical protein